MMTGLLHTHTLSVVLFLLIYLTKAVLLWTSPTRLESFNKRLKVPEMVVSTLFLLTGLGLAYHNASIGVGSWFWIKLGAVFVAIPLAVVGYRRHNKALATLSLLLVVYAYGVSETKSARMIKTDFAEAGRQLALQSHPELSAVVTEPMDSSGKTNANYDLVAHGKSVFLSQCALCHGEDGKKGLGGAKNLQETRLDKNQIMDLLLNGKNTMPSYRNVLSQQEMMAVVAYVKIQFAPQGH
ncbi:MAG: c-type cytochrome [Bacteroidota bacterium]